MQPWPAERSASPERGTQPRLRDRPWWPGLRRLLLLAFLSGVGYLIWRQAQSVAWAEVWQSVRAYPARTLVLCGLLAVLSFGIYSSFDLIGRHYTGHRVARRAVVAVTFVCYVFNLNLGSLVGGLAFRFRLYSRLGLDYGQISQVLGLSMVTNWLGYLLLAGTLFMLRPLPLPPDWPIDAQGLQLLGAGLVLLGLAYLGLCFFSKARQFDLRGHTLHLPSGRMAALQAGLGAANWSVQGLLIAQLMPQAVDVPSAMAVLLLGAVAGVITHVPAGLGVLETVFISLLSHRAPAHQILAALLTYRLVYHLVPLAVAVAVFAVMEWRARQAGKASGA